MKIICIILGTLSLILGVIGIALPLLPTTPFLLLSAALYAHASPRLHRWLLNNRILGEYIRNYTENHAMPLRAKLTSVTLVWASLLYCALYVARGTLWVQITFILLAIAITWHILSLGTTPRRRK